MVTQEIAIDALKLVEIAIICRFKLELVSTLFKPLSRVNRLFILKKREFGII